MIGAELKMNNRKYSPCGVAITSDSDFVASDFDLINTYNTDVFCRIGVAVVPVYSNLADIPAASLPNGLSVKVTDEAYPSKARWVNTNFRLDYLYPGSDVGSCSSCHSVGAVGFVPPVWLPFVIKVAAAIVLIVAVGYVVVRILNSVLALMLPGGVSGHEREITDTKKLITYPDGSWAVYDTTTGEIVTSGVKPDTWAAGIIVPIVIGVAGIAGIYVFVKYGMPALTGAFGKPVEAK